MKTPFETHAAVLRDGSDGASPSLQDLTLNRWNGEGRKVDMGRFARTADAEHWASDQGEESDQSLACRRDQQQGRETIMGSPQKRKIKHAKRAWRLESSGRASE